MTTGSRNSHDLIKDLEAKDATTRRHARLALETRGEAALDPLVEALAKGTFPVRWEAAKALGHMYLPGAVPALVRALEDEEHDVRWLAATALAHTGRPALAALLTAFVQNSDSTYLRQGLSHFLAFYRDEPLHDALSHLHDAIGPLAGPAEAVTAARQVLDQLGT